MKEILTNLHIPDTVKIGGTVYSANGTLEYIKSKNGEIEKATIDIKLICEIDVDGVEIKFNSHISHQLTVKELDELMLKFNEA